MLCHLRGGHVARAAAPGLTHVVDQVGHLVAELVGIAGMVCMGSPWAVTLVHAFAGSIRESG